ncbi:MAG: C39 family peptidase [Eubacteriales bacterium]
MPINPATIKAALTAIDLARKKENRDTMLLAIFVPVITVLLLSAFVIYILTSPLSFFATFLFGDELDLIDDMQQNYGFNQSLGVFEADYIWGSLQNYVGIEFVNGETTVMYYNQLDSRWRYEPYGTDKIGTHGCGPTAMAMVVSSLTTQTVDPITMSQWSVANGGWASTNGSYHSFIPNAATAWELEVEGLSKDGDMQKIVDTLSSGGLVVALMSAGHFTSGGHYIVLRGVTATGKILVADPSSYSRSDQEWELALIVNESRNGASAGGPFWLISAPEPEEETEETEE